MTSIRLNQATAWEINYVGGQQNQLILNPGVNIGVDDREWSFVKKHPLVKLAIETKVIDELLSNPEAKLEIGNIPVIDQKQIDEPVPVTPAKAAKTKANSSDVVK